MRPEPSMGPQNYKTYAMSAPLKTHWRQATCEEYECEQYLHGFVTTIDVSWDLGQKQFEYLSHDKTRRGTMQRQHEHGEIHLRPRQQCFNWGEHRVPIGKPPRLLVLGGDWRGNPNGQVRRHTRVEHWVEDSAGHLDHLTKK